MPLTQVQSGVITDGSITASKIATGAAVSNIGYTPVNKAGDTVTGSLNLTTSSANLAFNGVAFKYNLTHNYNDAGTVNTNSANVAVQISRWFYIYEYDDYLGASGGTTNAYWYMHIPAGMYFVGSYIVEAMQGGWSYGQAANYARWIVQIINGTATVTNLESVGATNLACTAKCYNANTGSNMYQRIAVQNSAASNSVWFRVQASNPVDYWSGYYTGRQSTSPTA